MYHESATTAVNVTNRPMTRPIVGERLNARDRDAIVCGKTIYTTLRPGGMRIPSSAAAFVVSIAAGTVLYGQAPICHVASPTSSAHTPAHLRDGVGRVHMPISTRSADAQAFFDQGLALLHAFWYYE